MCGVGCREIAMICRGLSAAIVTGLLWLALTAPLRAQNAQPEHDDSRYTFHRAAGGFLRLDGRSGQVSVCNRRRGAWQCQAVVDERLALQSEIARLQTENSELKKQLLARDPAAPGPLQPAPDPPTAVVKPPPQPTSDDNSGRLVGFFGKVWRRVVEMIMTAQRDILKTS